MCIDREVSNFGRRKGEEEWRFGKEHYSDRIRVIYDFIFRWRVILEFTYTKMTDETSYNDDDTKNDGYVRH